jgi:alkylation response protein AidB-like acyl-CoA dehydrogenase
VSGEVILHGDELYCHVSIGGFGPGEILFRRCRGRSDYVGERNHWARMTELVDHSRLAARIAREIGLACVPESQPRLVA